MKRTHEWTLWVVAVSTVLHAIEELLTGWREWAPESLGITVSVGTFIFLNAVLSVAAFALAWVGRRRPVASLVIPMATLANALFFHILPSVVQRTPVPGVYTAVALYLPFSSWALIGAARDGVSRRAIGLVVVIGLAIAFGVVTAARAMSGRW